MPDVERASRIAFVAIAVFCCACSAPTTPQAGAVTILPSSGIVDPGKEQLFGVYIDGGSASATCSADGGSLSPEAGTPIPNGGRLTFKAPVQDGAAFRVTCRNGSQTVVAVVETTTVMVFDYSAALPAFTSLNQAAGGGLLIEFGHVVTPGNVIYTGRDCQSLNFGDPAITRILWSGQQNRWSCTVRLGKRVTHMRAVDFARQKAEGAPRHLYCEGLTYRGMAVPPDVADSQGPWCRLR